MALLPAWKFLTEGEVSNAFGALFVSQDEFDRGKDADDRLSALVNKQYENGQISAAAAARTIQNIEANRLETGAIFEQPGTNVWEGFKDGWKEGAAAEQKLFRNTLNGIGGFVWGSIPLWVWFAGLVALLWYLGLMPVIVRFIRSKAGAR